VPTLTPHIESFTLGEFQTNCFVVTVPDAAEKANDCWIVDCGFEPEPMFDHIDDRGLNPVALLLTHAHADHIAGVDALLARYGALPTHLHEAEAGFCSDPMLNLSGLMGMAVTCAEPEHALRDGDSLSLNGAEWRVVHAPGHSPGCVLFIHDASNQAIVGDTLFAGSIGRIDFPTSDPEKMRHSIFQIIMKLPDEMRIHPGHMQATTIGRERASNPFVLGGF
jgi:glyoxylase-like metal-dependent hydrolase (beta-lactamase superfamily II)